MSFNRVLNAKRIEARHGGLRPQTYSMKTIGIYILAWFGMVVLAIANGIIREKFYSQSMSELSAHQLSTFIAIVLFGLYIYSFTGFFQIQTAKQAFTIGAIWFIMTVIFEFGFGHYIAGHAWSRLLMDYDILKGRVWILVLVWTFTAPYVFYRIRL